MNRSRWEYGLLDAMNFPSLRIISNDIAVVIKDRYPKAKYHFLVLPKEDIDNLFELTQEHLGTLDEMRLLADNVIEILGLNKNKFKIGYHASPSMKRLHLHVISTDFNSPGLKTKHHWNTFTTSIFILHEDLVEEIKSNGHFTKWDDVKINALLKLPLKCNSCNYKPKHMPDLKNHLLKHC